MTPCGQCTLDQPFDLEMKQAICLFGPTDECLCSGRGLSFGPQLGFFRSVRRVAGIAGARANELVVIVDCDGGAAHPTEKIIGIIQQ